MPPRGCLPSPKGTVVRRNLSRIEQVEAIVTRGVASRVVVSVVAAFLIPGSAAEPVGAKALFDGAFRGPVGIHYWFENGRGSRSSEARAAGAGAHVRLHIRSNVDGFLTVWTADQSGGGGVQLTPMEGQWSGYLLRAGREYVVPGDLAVSSAEPATRVLVLFARAQMEQVGSAADAREKIQRLSAAIGRDGALSIVRETDDASPGQVGNYVVHREGAQAGAEIVIGP